MPWVEDLDPSKSRIFTFAYVNATPELAAHLKRMEARAFERAQALRRKSIPSVRKPPTAGKPLFQAEPIQFPLNSTRGISIALENIAIYTNGVGFDLVATTQLSRDAASMNLGNRPRANRDGIAYLGIDLPNGRIVSNRKSEKRYAPELDDHVSPWLYSGACGATTNTSWGSYFLSPRFTEGRITLTVAYEEFGIDRPTRITVDAETFSAA